MPIYKIINVLITKRNIVTLYWRDPAKARHSLAKWSRLTSTAPVFFFTHWKEHNTTSVINFPKNAEPHSNHEKTSDKPKLKDIP